MKDGQLPKYFNISSPVGRIENKDFPREWLIWKNEEETRVTFLVFTFRATAAKLECGSFTYDVR